MCDGARHVFKKFAGEQKIAPSNAIEGEASVLLYQWYKDGYIALNKEENS